MTPLTPPLYPRFALGSQEIRPIHSAPSLGQSIVLGVVLPNDITAATIIGAKYSIDGYGYISRIIGKLSEMNHIPAYTILTYILYLGIIDVMKSSMVCKMESWCTPMPGWMTKVEGNRRRRGSIFHFRSNFLFQFPLVCQSKMSTE